MNPRRALALAALAALAAAGCGRRERLELPGGDSALVQRPDSAAVVVREAQRAWEAPGGGEAAARASARALALVLAARPAATWAERARGFLDSLGVGAEVADAGCVLAVNFFSRSDPGAGSWPWLFWCEGDGLDGQPVEGRSLRLLRAASRGLAAGVAAKPARAGQPPPAVALLFDRRAASGSEPLVMTWLRRGRAWEVVQSLGPDSLGGAGTGDFEAAGDSLTLVTRTYRASRGFAECPTCPHVYHVRRFGWGPGGFTRLEDREVPSPYSAFVRFVQALAAGDRAAAEARVTDPGIALAAERAGFGSARGLWRVAPATAETATSMVFLRGAAETYRVRFVPVGADWRIDGIEATERRVE
jgi:hypothetical protein